MPLVVNRPRRAPWVIWRKDRYLPGSAGPPFARSSALRSTGAAAVGWWSSPASSGTGSVSSPWPGNRSGRRRRRAFMLRMSSTVAIAISTMMNRPIGPISEPSRVSPKLFTANGWTAISMSPTVRSHASPGVRGLPDAGEEVGLRHGAVDQRAAQLEVLRRPAPPLQLQRHVEPEAVRVDLGGVGPQRVVADVEVLAALDPC